MRIVKSAVIPAGLGLLIFVFQNCTLNRFSSAGNSLSAQNNTNGGFDGDNGDGGISSGPHDKTFSKSGVCDGKAAAKTVILIDDQATHAYFLRENCADNSGPYANRIQEVDVSALKLGMLSLFKDGAVLTANNPDGSVQDITNTAICRPPPPAPGEADVSGTPTLTMWSPAGNSQIFLANILFPTTANGEVELDSVPLTVTGGANGSGLTYSNPDRGITLFVNTNGFSISYVLPDATRYSTTTAPVNCYSDMPAWEPYIGGNVPIAPILSAKPVSR